MWDLRSVPISTFVAKKGYETSEKAADGVSWCPLEGSLKPLKKKHKNWRMLHLPPGSLPAWVFITIIPYQKKTNTILAV